MRLPVTTTIVGGSSQSMTPHPNPLSTDPGSFYDGVSVLPGIYTVQMNTRWWTTTSFKTGTAPVKLCIMMGASVGAPGSNEVEICVQTHSIQTIPDKSFLSPGDRDMRQTVALNTTISMPVPTSPEYTSGVWFVAQMAGSDLPTKESIVVTIESFCMRRIA